MDDKDSLFLTDIPKLSEENMNLCEGKVTRNECFEVLKEMKFNKSPGNDGFIYGRVLLYLLASVGGNFSTSIEWSIIMIMGNFPHRKSNV